ncbi:hypothetical protein OPQ81_011125 [Rhizoctonia solani]|nr:hypothetical protein OPQ81_011125 [Rhizoctonia solani]
MKIVRGLLRHIKAYEHDHSQFYVMVVDIQLNLQGKQNNRIFFASNDERNKFYILTRKLQSLCEVYHTNVPSASQKGYLQETRKATTWTSNFSPRFKPTEGQLIERMVICSFRI